MQAGNAIRPDRMPDFTPSHLGGAGERKARAGSVTGPMWSELLSGGQGDGQFEAKEGGSRE